MLSNTSIAISPSTTHCALRGSFGRVEQKNPTAADLLRLCASLAPDAIPEEIITQGAAHLGPQLAAVGADSYLLNQSIEVLRAYSLLRREASSKTVPSLSVHRLVQAVLKDQMDKQSRQQWTERAVQAIDTAFPEVKFETWPQCDRLLPHALACTEMMRQDHVSIPKVAQLLKQAGWYLGERARYQEAEPLLVEAVAICELQGIDDQRLAGCVGTLSWLYNLQGKYEQAEPLFQRTLTIDEKIYGPEHREVATDLNNLALLYKTQGKYEQAEPLYQHALAICEQQLGPLHPDTATSLNNLAGLYQAQGKYEQAEPLYQRALAIREQQLGPQHPDTATSLNNLALLYYNQGKDELAESLY